MAISSMVDNLDDVEVLVELLKNTGENHSNRGVPKEDFDVRFTPPSPSRCYPSPNVASPVSEQKKSHNDFLR